MPTGPALEPFKPDLAAFKTGKDTVMYWPRLVQVARCIMRGLALGVALGVALDNIAVGIAIGIAIGAGVGAARAKRKG